MAVQAKFYVAECTTFAHQSSAQYMAPEPRGRVVLRPVSRGEENKAWASATPSGEFSMTINGGAFPWFAERVGRELSIVIDDVEVP